MMRTLLPFPEICSPDVSPLFAVRLAAESWEQHGYARLRRDVFCHEQQLFEDNDRDANDDGAKAIVAVSFAAGMANEVVGTVRIHQASPGTWFGSRLAIARDWRGVPNLAAELIRMAVVTACGEGCRTFLANVQRQNVPLFRRLHWRTLQEIEICGRPHRLMEADLDWYGV